MAINLIGGVGSSYDLLKEGIQAANKRAEVIANNMANVNTANYKKFSVVFEDNLKGINNSGLTMKKTNVEHMSNVNGEGNITVVQDKSSSMKEDGNNVDLDVEKVEQAANTLKYNALVQLASGKLSNISYVITAK